VSLAIDRLAAASRWRRRGLGEKSLLALGLLALTLALPPWPAAALVLAIAWTAALAGARVPPGAWLRLVAGPFGFALTATAALAVQIGPDGIALAADGGRAALLALLRASAALSCLLLLAVTCPAPDLVRGLRRLGVPAEIVEIALLIWRFLLLLLDSAAAIRTAQTARLGWQGWRRSLRSLGLLIALLLPRAMERARRLEVGLAARGFDGSLPVLRPAAALSWGFIAATLTLEAGIAGIGLWWN
jgi:cobalt/nickel transport system permease protein